MFLHARFGLSGDPLEPYKDVISRWFNPPDFRSPISVRKAKKAISDYKAALGQPDGLAELTVFYCEQVFDFLAGCGIPGPAGPGAAVGAERRLERRR